MPDPPTARPAICLSMIVRNEAHISHEVLDSVAPHISSWVIVDTSSGDGDRDLIRSQMSRLGIPGELHERPWRNFGHNRTEALNLAQGHGDYIWVMDADDTVVGTPDFTRLRADIYLMRSINDIGGTFWRPRLFRDGLAVRYVGVTHERPKWDLPYVVGRVEGEYHVKDRHCAARAKGLHQHSNDRDLLLVAAERSFQDRQSVFARAQSFFAQGDFANARKWYARRAEMGGWDEEVYYAMYRVALSMAKLGAPWPDIEDAYLRAWEFRPARAEPLYEIAFQYRLDERYRLAYLFSKRAVEIPFPEENTLFVDADLYAWRATDEQALCASWIDKYPEAFTLWRRLLARPDIPDEDRQRIASNRDICAPTMLEAASAYPDALVGRLTAGTRDAEVIVSLVAGPDPTLTEQTLNSFLNCCTDVLRVGRFLVVDAGLSAADRITLAERYAFLEFFRSDPDAGPGAQLALLRDQINGRFWLHLGEGWRFFAPDDLITRLTAVLQAEPLVFQVAVNFADATKLTGSSAPEQAVHRALDTGRYVLTNEVACGPAMFDAARLDQAGGVHSLDPDPIAALARRAATSGMRTASLDEVLCIAAIPQVLQPAQLQPGATKNAPTRFAVAIVSPPGYRHSEVFREVAQALHCALLAIGHDSVLTNRLDFDDRSTIVLGSNLLARYDLEPPKHAILYNLEQVDEHSTWMTPALIDLFRRCPVWDYSQANIEQLTAWRIPRVTHVPIGYVPELTRVTPVREDIDVLFYGSPDDRREAVLDKLRAQGLRVKSLFGVYGASRDAWIARSKIVINIHVSYYKAQVFEIVRVSYLLANRRAVVSERGAHPNEDRDLESGIAFAEYDELVDRCLDLLADERARRELGERGYRAFSARSQADILRRALSSGTD